ncbi:MAG: Rid family hydrolase [Betaproteobacteria bacterium]
MLLRTAHILLATLLSLSFTSAAQSPGKTIFIPGKAESSYARYHYAPAIRVGDMVIISGIPAGGPGSYSEQVRRMLVRAKETLEVAGATMADVVEIQSFHVNARSSAEFQTELADFLTVHKEFFNDAYPAWTAIGNSVLLSPGAVVEVRFVAYIGAGKQAKVVHVPAPAVVTK